MQINCEKDRLTTCPYKNKAQKEFTICNSDIFSLIRPAYGRQELKIRT
jgi:hypothetical protein